ncbi:MAG: hypothetical protein H6Q83_1638, partial [Deltaproteobacteria bacterium]|nr:hypothetical protein [Deltaproteobacteria bacterium]
MTRSVRFRIGGGHSFRSGRTLLPCPAGQNQECPPLAGMSPLGRNVPRNEASKLQMMFPLPRLSFEHVALALAKRGTSPCVQWMRIPPGARSFLAARLFERLGRTFLYLCAGEKEAEEAARELTAYLGPDAVLPFPSIEATPYEPVPPHLPSVHDRIRALHRLLSGPPAVVVGP